MPLTMSIKNSNGPRLLLLEMDIEELIKFCVIADCTCREYKRG